MLARVCPCNSFGYHRANWLAMCVCLVLISGCGESGPKRHRLTGTVKFDGAPLKYGTIYFDPDQGNQGPQGFAEVIDGAYDTKANGRPGVISGKVVVRIMGFKEKPEASTSSDEPKQALFEEFKESIELPDSDSKKDFDVPKEAIASRRDEVPAQSGP